jgi:hypothetical protein
LNLAGSLLTKQSDAPDYDLTCWYLNARRVIELVGARDIALGINDITALAHIDDSLRKNMVLSVLKE